MEDCKDVGVFFSATHSLTTGYLARAVVNNVLKGGQLATAAVNASDVDQDDFCRVS